MYACLTAHLKSIITENEYPTVETQMAFHEITFESMKRMLTPFPQTVWQADEMLLHLLEEYMQSHFTHAGRLEATSFALVKGVFFGERPLDYFREQHLGMEWKPLVVGSKKYEILNDFLQKTQHRDVTTRYNVESIFKICKLAANDRFDQDQSTNIHYLLHSSYANNVIGILKDGLLIRPANVRGSGRNDHTVDDGIYFWNTAAGAVSRYNKPSFNGCVLLVCAVALGRTYEKTDFHDKVDSEIWSQFDSVIFKGPSFINIPPLSFSRNEYRNFIARNEDLKEPKIGFVIRYNEYKIKNEARVRIDYVVKMKKI